MKPRRFKINKDKFKCPVAIFEPPDIRKKSMYAKQLVISHLFTILVLIFNTYFDFYFNNY